MTIDLIASDGWRGAKTGVSCGMLALDGVRNPERDSAIDAEATRLERQLREQFGELERPALRTIEPLAAYTAYYKRFGQQYHVAMQIESIARKGKLIPRVAALVEATFIAELESMILTGGHDLNQVSGDILLDVSDGSVVFNNPRGEPKTVKAGDSYTRDDAGVLSAIIAGGSDRGRIGSDTTAVVVIAYAPAGVPVGKLDAHLAGVERYVRLIAPDAVIVGRRIIES